MKKEVLARLALLLFLALAVLIPAWALWAAARATADAPLELHARMPEAGGWTPANLTGTVGQPLHLRLTSDDVMHGFVIGQTSLPPVEVKPGEVTDLTVTFDHPGTYTFYCDRWCGPNHWRMRGTIEVTGGTAQAAPLSPSARPLFVTLGIDLDAPHPADVIPEQKPSAVRGAALGVTIPGQYLTLEYYRAHSPVALWHALRTEVVTKGLTDQQVWDLVALVWQSNAAPEVLKAGWKGYAQNCAACHGETGGGNGILAPTPAATDTAMGSGSKKPFDFTDTRQMLGASPALLQGKIIRGGMGTGMPSWGPLFTEAQTWAFVDYLWMFQFEYAPGP
jgi:mono/diheme cytochrome c family protein/plastocyanin